MLGLGNSLLSGGKSEEFVVIQTWDFNDDTGTAGNSTANPSSATLPTGWAKADSGNFTIYSPNPAIGGDRVDEDLGSNQDSRGWTFSTNQTASGATGPGGGMDEKWSDFVATDPQALTTSSGFSTMSTRFGSWTNSTDYRYLLYESSVPASINSNVNISNTNDGQVIGVIRTNELDFTGFSKVYLQFFVHAHGAGFGTNSDGGSGDGTIGACAIAVTDSATSASSADQTGAGLGISARTTGGAVVTVSASHEDADDSSYSGQHDQHTTNRIGSLGELQASGHTDGLDPDNNWRYCVADISAAAGSSSNYIHFVCFAAYGIESNDTQNFRQDFAIDNVRVVGLK